MVVDTSPVVAITMSEPGSEFYVAQISGAGLCVMSAVSYVEATMVLTKLRGPLARQLLDGVLADMAIKVVEFTADHGVIAAEAFLRFGKGRHPAKLNYGDCMVYALAKQRGEPLLFIGNDFSQTDLLLA